MKLTILGCHSATPHTDKAPTAQLLSTKKHHFLIDCGEGTQVLLRKAKVKFAHIKHIFISHLHGDHFYGLPGLISTFRLLGREAPLHIYGPVGIREAVTLLLKLSDSWTNYPLYFHELTEKEPVCLFSDGEMEVHTIPLKHRVYTNGFLFRETPKERKINPEAVKKLRIDQSQMRNLKQGKDVVNTDGESISNTQLTHDPKPSKAYAFCSDTAYHPEMTRQIQGVDVLYHEATFLDDNLELAKKTDHSTAKQAAQIAKDANVNCLILGHYSSRYKNLELFQIEAAEIFPNVELAYDGYSLEF
jgi:ribonuclease Z